MKIWPFLFIVLAGIAATAAAELLSGGLPWGVDDGVKRLMARQWIQSGYRSVVLSQEDGATSKDGYFPIPPPFAEPAESGYSAVFPALFPAMGGYLRSLFGDVGLYLLPAFCFVLVLFYFAKLLRGFSNAEGRLWAALLLASSLLFYALTFWEHIPALLCLLPLMNLLVYGREKAGIYWFWAGAALGLAIALRPEMALLLPPLLIALGLANSVHTNHPHHKWRCLLPLLGGCASIIAGACIFEYFVAGRFIPRQVGANLALVIQSEGLAGHLKKALAMLFNSPANSWIFAALVFAPLLISALTKTPFIFACSLPLASFGFLIWGWLAKGAFGLAAGSQGLFWAWPWIGILLMRNRAEKRRPDALEILAVGYLILFYLLAPDQLGMHWGPRFLFPALLPLLFRTVSLQRGIASLMQRRALMLITAVFALASGLASAFALGERGSAGEQVISIIRRQRLDWLAVNRWYLGADLEPLWADLRIAWTPELGSFEEQLIGSLVRRDSLRSGCLWQGTPLEMDSLPLRVESRSRLPKRAGWGGELIDFRLADSLDGRWGDVFWHAARRRTELNDLAAALYYFEKAVALNPKDPDLLYDLAVCFGRMGRIDDAKLALERVLDLNPHHEAGLSLWRRLAPSR